MNQYSHLHQIDALANYGRDNQRKTSDPDKLASFIHRNYDKMEMTEKKHLLMRIIPDNEVNHLLLEYEMKHLSVKPRPMSLKDFEKKALKILSRYQSRAGGFSIEDREWGVHHYGSTERELRENELLFDNTICKIDLNNPETDRYLKNLEKLLNRISQDIDVEIRFKSAGKEDRDVIWIMIWATHSNMGVSAPEISL